MKSWFQICVAIWLFILYLLEYSFSIRSINCIKKTERKRTKKEKHSSSCAENYVWIQTGNIVIEEACGQDKGNSSKEDGFIYAEKFYMTISPFLMKFSTFSQTIETHFGQKVLMKKRSRPILTNSDNRSIKIFIRIIKIFINDALEFFLIFKISFNSLLWRCCWIHDHWCRIHDVLDLGLHNFCKTWSLAQQNYLVLSLNIR